MVKKAMKKKMVKKAVKKAVAKKMVKKAVAKKLMKKAVAKKVVNKWMNHLQKVRKANPKLSLSEAMVKAKMTYKK